MYLFIYCAYGYSQYDNLWVIKSIVKSSHVGVCDLTIYESIGISS